MSQSELLTKLTRVLESGGVAYMLTGSWASSIYGEPRSTHDVDLVIDVDRRAVVLLRGAFDPTDYAFDEVAAGAAISGRGMFQLWHFASGDSVDFWVCADEPYSRQSFSRRRKIPVLDFEAYVCSPEDVIVQKLRWAEMSGGSEKQMNDVRGVFELQRDILDLSYIEHWVHELGVGALWQRTLDKSRPL